MAADHQYFYEDEVFRINKNGKIIFGMVIENFELYSSDDSSTLSDEEETKVEEGHIRVAWHPHGREEVISERQVGLANRSLMPGDVVRRLDGGKDTMKGYCRNIHVNACVQIKGTNKVIENIDSKSLVPIEKLSNDTAIVMDSWVGAVKLIHIRLTLVLQDGSKCYLSDPESYLFQPCNEQNDKFEGNHYPGQCLRGPIKYLNSAEWIHCTKATKVLLANKSSKKVKVYVDAVDTISALIHWKCQICSKEGSENEKQPHMLILGEDFKKLRLLNYFKACTLQVGDRNMYEIKSTDKVLTKSEWKKNLKEKLSQSKNMPKPSPEPTKVARKHSNRKSRNGSKTPAVSEDKMEVDQSPACRVISKENIKRTPEVSRPDVNKWVEGVLGATQPAVDEPLKKTHSEKESTKDDVIKNASKSELNDEKIEETKKKSCIFKACSSEEGDRFSNPFSNKKAYQMLNSCLTEASHTLSPCSNEEDNLSDVTNTAECRSKLFLDNLNVKDITKMSENTAMMCKEIFVSKMTSFYNNLGSTDSKDVPKESEKNQTKEANVVNIDSMEEFPPLEPKDLDNDWESIDNDDDCDDDDEDEDSQSATNSTCSSTLSSKSSNRSSQCKGNKPCVNLMAKVLKKKKLNGGTRKKKPNIKVEPGDRFVVETVRTFSAADVVWQDGSIELGIPSTELYPIHHLDDQEFFPGDFVIENRTGDVELSECVGPDKYSRLYGVIQSVDHAGRTAKLKWFLTYLSPEESVPILVHENEMSVYDLKDHPDFQFRPGNVVIRLGNFDNEHQNATAGQILDIYPEGQVSVWWAEGFKTMSWPQDLYKLNDNDSDDSEIWEYSGSEGVWETENEEILSNKDSPTTPTSPSQESKMFLKFKLAENIEAARLAMKRLERMMKDNPALITSENVKKFLGVYKDCRCLDKFLGTSFFHEKRFHGLIQKVKEHEKNIESLKSAETISNDQNSCSTSGVSDDLNNSIASKVSNDQSDNSLLKAGDRNRSTPKLSSSQSNSALPKIASNPLASNRVLFKLTSGQNNIVISKVPSGHSGHNNSSQCLVTVSKIPSEQSSSVSSKTPSSQSSSTISRTISTKLFDITDSSSSAISTESTASVASADSIEKSTSSKSSSIKALPEESDSLQSQEKDPGGDDYFSPPPKKTVKAQPVINGEFLSASLASLEKEFFYGIKSYNEPLSEKTVTNEKNNESCSIASNECSNNKEEVYDSQLCLQLCALILEQLMKAQAEVNKRFGNQLETILEPLEKELRVETPFYGCEKLKPIEGPIPDSPESPDPEPSDPYRRPLKVLSRKRTKSLPNIFDAEGGTKSTKTEKPNDCSVDSGVEAELEMQTASEIKISIQKEGEGFSVLSSVPESHKFEFAKYSHPVNPTNFYKTVRNEIKLLLTSLPYGITVKGFDDRMDLYSAMIEGPEKTPYEDGLFFFDFQLPADYPDQPPLCRYVSYCTDRLNPNLYEDGKVCVSLLGTWSGRGTEVWTSSSNLLQVLVSIQGLILVSEPYFNEAGYEKQKGTQQGHVNSQFYNEMVVLKLVQAMTKLVVNPPSIFQEEIVNHFSARAEKMCNRLEKWLLISEKHSSLASSSEDQPMQETVETADSLKPPEFPLLPASKGFCLSLRKALNNFKDILKSTGILKSDSTGNQDENIVESNCSDVSETVDNDSCNSVEAKVDENNREINNCDEPMPKCVELEENVLNKVSSVQIRKAERSKGCVEKVKSISKIDENFKSCQNNIKSSSSKS